MKKMVFFSIFVPPLWNSGKFVYFQVDIFWNTFWCSFIPENLGSVALLVKNIFWLKKSKILHFATQNWPKIAYFSLF